jgi:uncharacterized protein (TIGR01777 family)
MRIVMAGASGLIGMELHQYLAAEGHDVHLLVRDRSPVGPARHYWNPYTGELDAAALQSVDAVINLAGDNIASGRWTTRKKQAIRDSRVLTTRTLARAIERMRPAPSVWVNASAIGFYGDRSESVDETSPAGEGFLPEVCQAWEREATLPDHVKTRVVWMRTGIVLTRNGGALQKMLPAFRFGVGGMIGTGAQPMSWVSLKDVCRMYAFALTHEALRGPVNAVSPEPVTNAEFSKALARAVHRPAMFRVPRLALTTWMGEMAEALLLQGAKVLPRKLLDAGYAFSDPELNAFLRKALSRI